MQGAVHMGGRTAGGGGGGWEGRGTRRRGCAFRVALYVMKQNACALDCAVMWLL